MKFLSRLLLTLITAMFCTGCATLFSKSNQKVMFQTNEPGANVFLDGQLVGKTPVEFEINNNNDHIVRFEKTGFESNTVFLNTSIGGGWIILDILGGLIPVIVDAGTGKWRSLNDTVVNATLSPS